MREDDQIWSCLALKKIITLNSKWTIKSENQEVVDFITYVFNNLDDIFIKKLYEIFSAYDYGFSVTEKIAELRDTPFGKKIIYKKLATRAPHTFEIRLDDFGNIIKLIQYLSNGNKQLDLNNFIIFSYNKEFDNPYGQSDLNKGVYRAWWSKDAIIKFWNIYLERFGSPTAVGKIPRSAGSKEREDFIKVMKNLQSKTAITIPADFELMLLQSTNSAGEFESAIDKYNTIIARKLLIPDLMGFSGGKTAGGSFALGKEQFDIFYTMRNYDRQSIEKIVNKDLIKPLLEWNYIKEEAEFSFSPVDDDQKESMLKLWLESVKTGKIPVNLDTTNWFLRNVDAPEIEEGEWNKIEEEKQSFKDTLNKNDKVNDKMNDKSSNENLITKKMNDENTNKKEEKKSYSNLQEYIQYEKQNIKEIGKKLDELDKKHVKPISESYLLCINAIKEEISSKKIIESKRLDLINKLDLKYTTNRTALWKQCLKDSFNSAKITVNYQIGLDDEDVISWLNENALYTSLTENDELLKQIKGILIDSIRAGNSYRDTVSQIDKISQKYDLNISAGENVLSRIENLVSTNISKAFNEARAQQYEKLSDEIIAYEYSAILDQATSPICRSLNGKIFEPSEMRYYNPPNHYRCRSLLMPIFRSEKFSGFDSMPNTEQEKGGFLKLIETE